MSVAGLCIGLNYPNTRMSLRGCVHDAHAASRVFKTHAPTGAKLRLLVDDGAGAVPCNRAAIWEALDWLRATGAKALFLHFSGHGTWSADVLGASDESDGRDEAIVAADGKISDDRLFRDFVAKLPASSTLFAVMDCCHSGTVLDLPWLFSVDPVVECTRAHKAQPACRALAISGCKDVGVSADAYNREEDRFEGALSAALYGTVVGQRSVAALLALPLGDALSTLHKTLFDKGFTQSPRISCTSPVNADTRFATWPAVVAPAPAPPATATATATTTTTTTPSVSVVSSFAAYMPPPAMYGVDGDADVSAPTTTTTTTTTTTQTAQPLDPQAPDVEVMGPYHGEADSGLYAW